MRVSVIVALLAVAGVPASCKKKATTSTELTPEQSQIVDSALLAWRISKVEDPTYPSYTSVLDQVWKTATYKPPRINDDDAPDEAADKDILAASKAGFEALPKDAKTYQKSLNSEENAMLSSLTKSLLENAATATYTPPTPVKKPWTTVSATSGFETIVARAHHKHSSATSKPSSATTDLTPEQSNTIESLALLSEEDAIENSAMKAMLERTASATSTSSKTQVTNIHMSDRNNLNPRAPKHKQKLTASGSSSAASMSEMTPQQSFALDEAEIAWLNSKINSPAYTSYVLDAVEAAFTMPDSVFEGMMTMAEAAAEETDSAAHGKWSSVASMLPPADQRYLSSFSSDFEAFGSSLRISILGNTAITTSSSGNNISAATITRRTVPEETYPLIRWDDDKSELSLDGSNMTPQEEAEFQLAQTQYNTLISSPEYESVKERLKEEPSDLPDADDFWDPDRSQKGKFDARLKKFLKPFPSYAKSLISSDIALQNKMQTMTQLAATRTKVQTSPVSTLSKSQAVTSSGSVEQGYTKTIVDIFTVTSMTPEQSTEEDRKVAGYFTTFLYPAIASLSAKFASEGLERTWSTFAPLADAAEFPEGAGKSSIDAWISSELDSVPTDAQPLLSSGIYGLLSIQSDVMNNPLTVDMSVSTLASTEITSEGLTTSAVSASTSVQPSIKTHTKHTKTSKTKGTITSRAILPLETVNPVKDWTPEQKSAWYDGLESLSGSLDANPTAVSLSSKYSTYFTAPVWTQLQQVIASIASSQTKVTCFCRDPRVNSVLADLPADGASFLCQYWDEQASLFSSVDKMRGSTTTPTTLEIKAKRGTPWVYSDPVYGTRTPDANSNQAEFNAWHSRHSSARDLAYSAYLDSMYGTLSPYSTEYETGIRTGSDRHLQFLTWTTTVYYRNKPTSMSASESDSTISAVTGQADWSTINAPIPVGSPWTRQYVSTTNVNGWLEYLTVQQVVVPDKTAQAPSSNTAGSEAISSGSTSIMSTTAPSSYDSPTTISSSKTDTESVSTAGSDSGSVSSSSSSADSSVSATPDDSGTKFAIAQPSIESTASAESKVSATPDIIDTKSTTTQTSIETTPSADPKVSTESKLSTESAASTDSAVNKQATSATQIIAASPTHHSSASSKGMLTAGVLGLCLVGVMALL